MSSLADMVARYRHFRDISMKVLSNLTGRLSKDVLEEGARDLGIGQDGVFVFESEDETSILMDYCIYNVLRDGRNAVQEVLATEAPAEGSDERLLLEAMSRAWYSLFVVKQTAPEAGCCVED